MKKILAVMISAAIVFSMAVMPVSASAGYEKELDILKQLGIADSDYGEIDGDITRGEFAALLAGIMGYDGGKISGSYKDVEQEHYLADKINYATERGVFKGYSDGSFRMEEKITWEQAAVSAVTALGYEKYAEANGGFPTGYVSMASSMKLIKGLGNDSTISYGQAAEIVYNMLDTEIMSIDMESIATDRPTFSSGGKTPLSEWLDLEKTEGLVTSVDKSYLTSNGETPNELVIGGKALGISGDYADLLGFWCEAYYGKNQNSNELAAIAIMPNKNDTTVIDCDDVVGYNGEMLQYEDGDRVKNIKITASDEVSKNGTAVKSGDRKAALENASGIITVNRLSSSDISVAVMIDAYETYFVGGINAIDMLIYDKIDKTRNLTLDPDDTDVVISDSEGKAAEFADIQLNNVLTVYANGDGTRVRIIISKEKTSGTYEGKNTGYGKTKYSVDGTEYTLANDYANINPTDPIINTDIQLYLDSFGKVAYAEAVQGNDFTYGFLCKAVQDEDYADDAIFSLKIYTASGQFVRLNTAKKVKIDGQRVKHAPEFTAYLERGNDDVNTYQLIRYKTNSADEVSEIDTTYKGQNESENSLRYIYKGYSATGAEKEKLTFKLDNDFSHRVLINGSTTLMTVAKTFAGNEKVFKLGKGFINGYSYAMNAYCADENAIVADLLLFYSDTAEDRDGSVYGVVKKINHTIDSDDQPIIQIVLSNDEGLETTYVTTSEYKLDNVIAAGSTDGKTYELKAGDFVMLDINVLKEVVNAEILYSNEESKWVSKDNWYGSVHNENVSCGLVYQKSGNALRVLKDGVTPVAEQSKIIDSLYSYSLNRATFYVCESKTGKISEASLSEICDYKSGGSGASKVILYADGGWVYTVVIYR